MRVLTLITILLASTLHSYSQKWDYQWLFGYDIEYSGTPGFGLSLMDFNNGEVTIDYWDTANHNLGPEGSTICTKEHGELVLFTSGCGLWNNMHESLIGGGTLIDDMTSEINCPRFYPTYHSSIILPEINNDSIYYVLQKDLIISDLHNTVISTQLILHYIKDSGEGFVLEESKIVLDTFLKLGHMTAMLNEDQDKWWLSVTAYNTNRHFMYLIGGQDTISEPIIQEIGSIASGVNWDIGQAVYSPNGELFANNTTINGVTLFDFNNETGMLSNYQEIHYPNMETAKGLAFSPNSRFIYVTTSEDFYQIDLEATDSVDQVYHIGHVRSFDTIGWPIGLGYMILGPDCRLYVSPGSTSAWLHVVHQPDEKGAACLFEEKAINTPTRLAHHLPNIPNYHYPRGCDPTIGWGLPVATEEVVGEEQNVRLFPNPTRDKTSIQLNVNHQYDLLEVQNLDGKRIHQQLITKGQLQIDLDMASWPRGTYFIHLSGKVIPQSFRLVKQ